MSAPGTIAAMMLHGLTGAPALRAPFAVVERKVALTGAHLRYEITLYGEPVLVPTWAGDLARTDAYAIAQALNEACARAAASLPDGEPSPLDRISATNPGTFAAAQGMVARGEIAPEQAA